MPELEIVEVGEAKEKNIAEIIKLALGHASFENKDIGGLVFALLDSLSSDIILTEFEESDTTISLMSDLVDTIREELDDIAGRIDDEDEEEDKEEDDDDEIDDKEELRSLAENDNDEDEDEDDDDLPEELGEIDDEEDDEPDEIIPGAPIP